MTHQERLGWWQNCKWMSISDFGNLWIKIFQCLLRDWLSFFIESHTQHATHCASHLFCELTIDCIHFNHQCCRCCSKAIALLDCGFFFHAIWNREKPERPVFDAMFDWNRIQIVSESRLSFRTVCIEYQLIYYVVLYIWLGSFVGIVSVNGVVIAIVCSLWQ